ncbi:unnamed protein product [Adineta ricciae]|nr:unnamed protein product [Adineta ricciae]
MNDIHCSTICENVLWKPVSCQQCETHFCLKCITKWLEKNPNQCPLRCDTFVQRPCSKFIARQLAKLQIVCVYQPNGCNEDVSYDALEKHELTCNYRPVKCTNCSEEMLQKDLTEHRSRCTAAVTTSGNCTMVSESNDGPTQYADEIYLREQFEQFKRESQLEIQRLREQIQQTQHEQTAALVIRGIISDENQRQRTHLRSTVEIDQLHRNRIVPGKSTEATGNDKLFCTECRNVVLRPVCCQNCKNIFCNSCRPQIGFFNKITTFLGAQRPRHGRNNCEVFEEGSLPTDLVTDLARLSIRCAYAPNGCQETPYYYDLEDHERYCEFEMIPCQTCQMPISRRSPETKHSLQECFAVMYEKNPSGIQQQFTALLDATETVRAENRRLKAVVDNMRGEINDLKGRCEKKTHKRNA